ncbi:hybrid sensor histidine kinase/response regulator transcription factor [Bacteroides sp.]|uniref:hybrid sensor histidine kinase/response regulator transcription factor n=1 Tax=Bacteroides sp. TaxID=29523 RepID=UPI00262A7C87|nr:hybrid sensor histidine kinase/response regulator transcription factor [Bacteroides sp.]
MKRLFLYLIVNLLIVSLYGLYGQKSKSISFIHIGLNKGLSQSTVFDITQDNQGNMWFATHNGLNKFDGYDFTVYQYDEQDPHSIGSDIIRTCIKDKQGRIWIGTDEGLSLYNVNTDKFENFTYQENGKNLAINGIVEVNDKLLLLYVRKEKLLLFDTETFQYTGNSLTPSLSSIIPTALYRQDDHIYIGSNEGVFVYSIEKNTLKNIASEALRDKDIYTILQQSPIHLWIGTEGSGLFCIDLRTNEVKSYTRNPKVQNSISSNYIRTLALDSQNQLWIGTLNSLNIYNEKENSFNVYNSDPQESGSLSQASVRDIFMDLQGGMWLGTYFGGLNYYHPFKDRFYNLQSTVKSNSLNCNIIGCIQEDAEGNLWIGTNSGGVNFYNPHTQTFKHYTQKEGIGSNDVKVIYIDETNDQVYIGTHTGGLNILHRKSGRIETICTNETNNVYTLEPTENGEFWISGISSLLRFNPKNKKITPIHTQADGSPFLNKQITAIVRDSKHRLWLIGEKGLDVYTETDGQLLQCPILPSQFLINHKMVNCVFESGQNGIFWIGTRNGIYRFDEKTKEIKQYTTAQGLPNNVVHGIMEDSFGYLWLSTDKGLSRFQPQTEKFRNYTDNDGIQSNQFTNNAFCHTKSGLMYFGGINGITTFRPEQLPDNPYIPPVIITRLTLFNKTVYPGDETGILEKNISEIHSITLTAGQSMFALEFVVPNYISGTHNTFSYKLEGYDKEWYHSKTSRIASYSNLPQGTYRFLVKAANSDGRWNELPTKLEITILPVWYKTWWATLLFITLFIATTTFIFYYFWMRKSMKAQIQMELADKERQKELNEMKLQFFINISHELRTPLTMILAPLQEVLSKVTDRWILKQLEHVQKNTNRLLHLVNQLMDYRRAELGVFHLKVRLNPVHQIVKKNFLLYDRVARHKKITYNFYSEVEDLEVLCDSSYVELIINNLISNAFKYTHEGQAITVALKKEDGRLLLQVQDTGTGIPIDKQSKIFERFYQMDNEHIGTGIGLSLVHRLVELHHGEINLESAEGVGTTFTIYLPTNEDAYQPEEIATETGIKNEQAIHSTNSADMYLMDAETCDPESATPEAEERPRENILIVEDNTDIRQYLSTELGQSYRILEAENGEEALNILKEQEIDLVLTDVMMPVMDGLKLCKHIKQNLYTCHIPVIMLSAKTDLKEQLEGLQVGADDYIPKPFSLAVMTTKIKNLFRTRHRAIEHYSNSLEIEPEKVALNALDEELLKKAVEIVEKHMDNVDFSTYEFAREMCMSRSNLHIKMKALTGEATNEFIRKIRFNKACKLLKEERYTVAEISTFVGFNTPSYFTNCFKKHFGCLPSEYSKKGGNTSED